MTLTMLSEYHGMILKLGPMAIRSFKDRRGPILFDGRLPEGLSA
jgi:hypothetical protein